VRVAKLFLQVEVVSKGSHHVSNSQWHLFLELKWYSDSPVLRMSSAKLVGAGCSLRCASNNTLGDYTSLHRARQHQCSFHSPHHCPASRLVFLVPLGAGSIATFQRIKSVPACLPTQNAAARLTHTAYYRRTCVQATTGYNSSRGSTESIDPVDEDEEEEFWVYQGDDEIYDGGGNDFSGARGRERAVSTWGNKPLSRATRDRRQVEAEMLAEERQYTEADLAAVDEEFEELLESVQRIQEQDAEWSGEAGERCNMCHVNIFSDDSDEVHKTEIR
jgi:hypothetical protein